MLTTSMWALTMEHSPGKQFRTHTSTSFRDGKETFPIQEVELDG